MEEIGPVARAERAEALYQRAINEFRERAKTSERYTTTGRRGWKDAAERLVELRGEGFDDKG